MKITWLIDEAMIASDKTNDLPFIVRSTGAELIVEDYKYYMNRIPMPYGGENELTIAYGTIGFVRNKQMNSMGTVCSFFNMNEFKFSSYAPKMLRPELLLNDNYILIPFGELVRRKEFFFKIFETDSLFIRPDSCAKPFTGFVLTPENFDHEINTLRNLNRIYHNELIVITNAKKIDAEYRFFIVDHQVISGSQYMVNGEIDISPEFPEEALNVAKEVCEWSNTPDMAFVCDVGLCNGEMKIVEYNALSTSGMYACDVSKVLTAVSDYLIAEYSEDW